MFVFIVHLTLRILIALEVISSGLGENGWGEINLREERVFGGGAYSAIYI